VQNPKCKGGVEERGEGRSGDLRGVQHERRLENEEFTRRHKTLKKSLGSRVKERASLVKRLGEEGAT